MLDFENLIETITHIDTTLKKNATKAVNLSLTIRNLLILDLQVFKYVVGKNG